MGTRSLIHIKDNSQRTLVTIYQQFDGYLSGVGEELRQYLSGKILVNGIPCGEDTSKMFNGMGDLASQLIAYFKGGIGGLYIYPADTYDVGEEYEYTIYPKDGKIMLKIGNIFDDSPNNLDIKALKKKLEECE